MYKFSYFTQRANEVLNYAIKAAEDFGHNYIGSEHILLGLLKTDGGVAVNMLDEKGVTAEDIENLIKEYIGEGMQTKLLPMILLREQREFLTLRSNMQEV